MKTANAAAPERAAIMEILGSYGLPFVGAILDRFEYFKGTGKFFKRRVEKYKSTVFRVNMSSGPPFFSYNRIIILLDGKSFPMLYDLSKVDKSYLAGSYMPSLKFTRGYRSTIFMDPSCEKHHRLKSWCLDLLCTNREGNFLDFTKVFHELNVALENEMSSSGKASFNDQMDQLLCNFLFRSIAGANTVAPGRANLETDGPSCIIKWLAVVVAPTISSGILSKFLDDLTIHLFPLPFFLVSKYYHKLYNFLWMNVTFALDVAEKQFGLKREEAYNNLMFYIAFNVVGGLRIYFTSMLKYITDAGIKLHKELAEEVRGAAKAHGGLNGVGNF